VPYSIFVLKRFVIHIKWQCDHLQYADPARTTLLIAEEIVP